MLAEKSAGAGDLDRGTVRLIATDGEQTHALYILGTIRTIHAAVKTTHDWHVSLHLSLLGSRGGSSRGDIESDRAVLGGKRDTGGKLETGGKRIHILHSVGMHHPAFLL